MRRQLIRRVSKSARAGQVLAFFSVVLGIVAIVAHRFGSIDTLSFLMTGAVAAAIALIAIGFAIFGLWRMWSEGAKAGGAVLRTVIFAGLTLSPFIFAVVAGSQTPMINDVSTDWVLPPQFPIGSRIDITPPFSEPKSQTEIAQLQAEAYPDIVTQELNIEVQLANQIISVAAKSMGWKATSQAGSLASSEGLSQAFEARSLIFGFTDDIVVRLRRADNGLLLDVRSTGRAGLADLGAHAKQIRGFFAAFASEQRKRGV
jgi:ABC-type transport system involved in multi-copper enzyme maturation permease subunit